MKESITNPADILEKNRAKLVDIWNEFYTQEHTPADYFAALPSELLNDFYDKLEIHCKQVLKSKGYNQWAYNKYRLDQNGDDGATNLFADVNEHFLTSSDNDAFVNLKEIFKNGEDNINRNINLAIKRVLVNNRERTVIDRLLRRIEDIADDDTNPVIRNRTEAFGLKADYFTIIDKFPEERDPTNEEIEVVIGLVGGFKESPPKEGAKQASRIYTTEQLIEMMEIICDNLPTDVTPNTLETIFIDLIPDFLPDDFLIEKVFKLYGDVSFPLDTSRKLSIQDLDQSEQIIVKEAVQEGLKQIREIGIQDKCKVLKDYLDKKKLNVNALAKVKPFHSREDVEETLSLLGNIANKLFSTIENEVIAEVAFSKLFEEL